jgi:adenylate cyclase
VRFDRRRLTGPLAFAVGVTFVGWLLAALGLFNGLERRLLDLDFLLRGDRGATAPIVVVAIDYESLQRLGRWPWPRALHAQFVHDLTTAGASVLAFDVLFLDPDPADDAGFAHEIQRAGNVVLASTYGSRTQERFRMVEHRGPAPALLGPSVGTGYVDLWFDPDGYVRRFSPVRQIGADVARSFSLTIAERYRRAPVLNVAGGAVQWAGPGGPAIPFEPDGSLLVNYVGPPGAFPIIPYIAVIERRMPPDVFKGKIVIVGATAEAADAFFTPFFSRALPETSRLMPGVEIHASAVQMLLDGRFIRRAVGPWRALAFLLVLPLVAWFSVRWRPWRALSAFIGFAAVLLGAGYLAFTSLGLWLPLAAPLLTAPMAWAGLVAVRFARERREKEFVRSALELYVSPAVIAQVVEHKIDLALGGRRRPISVLFADVRGFTGLSERIAPEDIVAMLGTFFEAAGRIVLAHGGTLDKFIGDAVMAFWGAPAPQEDHALRAVRAAVEITAAAAPIDAELQRRFGERFRVSIGINTGDAVVGHIGSPQRLGYTAVGDPVNVAARVEALTREHDEDVLITQFTWELVKFDVIGQLLGTTVLRGRSDPVALYAVRGLKTRPP